jgi:hypothetical protein
MKVKMKWAWMRGERNMLPQHLVSAVADQWPGVDCSYSCACHEPIAGLSVDAHVVSVGRLSLVAFSGRGGCDAVIKVAKGHEAAKRAVEAGLIVSKSAPMHISKNKRSSITAGTTGIIRVSALNLVQYQGDRS